MALHPAAPRGDTRQQILQHAITLFARAGFAGVSVRDVAAAVGSSAANGTTLSTAPRRCASQASMNSPVKYM